MHRLRRLVRHVARLGGRDWFSNSDELPTRGWKADALRDFSRWLVSLPDASPPQPEEESWDLHALLCELVALRQEVRLLGREQAKMCRDLESSATVQQQAAELFRARAQQLSEQEEQQRRAVERACIMPFLDLRDALVRGHAAASNAGRGQGLFRRPVSGVRGVVQGYELALERHEAALHELGISVVPTVGERFDSRTMVAQESRIVAGLEGGRVIEELRSGFVQGGDLLRPADVVVSRGQRT